MPVATYHFSSGVLGKQVQMTALLPDVGPGERGGGRYGVLYLLHGLSDDATIWGRMTRLENLLRGVPLVVVMPDGYRGWYTNHSDGPAYGEYVMKDVMGFAERFLPVGRSRGMRGIGGLSMGGYGALRLGLENPGVFGSVHSHSGAVMSGTTPWAREMFQQNRAEFVKVFGEKPAGTRHDLLHLARRAVKAGARLPKLHIDCGTEDFLIEDNRLLHAKLEALRVRHTYVEHAGEHNWFYWDKHIAAAVAFHCRVMKIEGPKTA